MRQCVVRRNLTLSAGIMEKPKRWRRLQLATCRTPNWTSHARLGKQTTSQGALGAHSAADELVRYAGIYLYPMVVGKLNYSKVEREVN